MTETAQPADLLEKPRLFYEKLKEPFVGRDEEALTIVLALLSGEHVIIIGEPGTAKSALARRAALLLNAKFFKYLLTRFTEPSELFGPLDINALRKGLYKRITSNKLPDAEIAFLDEIFNANSAILNSLLSILQERVLYDGYSEIKVPLWSLVSASNRIPDEPELDALYDRLLFRHIVKPVPEELWEKLLDRSWMIEKGVFEDVKPVMSSSDLLSLNKLIFQVDLTSVKQSLLRLFAILEDNGMHLTDRRKGKTLKAIAAYALFNGRMKARTEDLFVLKYIAPRDAEDFDKINNILLEELRTPDKILVELDEIDHNVELIKKEVGRLKSFDPKLVEIYRSLKAARRRVAMISRTSDDSRVTNKVDVLINKIDDLLDEVTNKLGM
ncbi:MAG: MoxR family ATPase [Desulfurococcales archaeon]|nr:MoxR family ATPase [Desulfurococcales archaeon]MEB3759062.1 MoxR family ATPase [Desulfurococcales archaeon]MEB3773003.1 MoxR family ATPase [Desulfurococcales archaeon]MEB3798862.1 MoxR family ATPase [Desulfurococcales archaeon]MEB3845834.1 MoxR family ATPase [Desulfurococcales archaeon]